MCVQRLREDDQATIRVHVDALMITSKNKWDIDRGKLQNYIGTVFDFTCVKEVTVNLIKYGVEELK